MGGAKGNTPGATRRETLRRYPALAYLAAASALSLLLPSGLNVLQSGPTTLAEYAPVPGEGQGSSALGDLGAAASDGLGAAATGNGVGRGAATTAPAPPDAGEEARPAGGRVIRKPGTKRCVGDPPRQTEDPLSPPCVAFFEGDNGGETAKGVTRDEVKVVLKDDVNQPGGSSPVTTANCAEEVQDDDPQEVLLCKAFHKYFNDRYQTYQRTVNLFFSRNEKAPEIDQRLGPFAVASLGASSAFSERNIVAIGYQSQNRAQYTKYAPYQISFRPDIEDLTAIAAGYVCAKLHDRPARYAGDPLLARQTRKFGLWYGDGEHKQKHTDLMRSELKDRCGIDIPPEHVIVDIQPSTAPAAAARLRQAGVTTVLISMSNGSHPLATNYATQVGWFPEWVIPGRPDLRAIDTNFYGRLANQSQWANTFGITADYRRPGLLEQQWVQAYREGCPACPTPSGTAASAGPHLYDSLVMLFTGIQAAGPRLTPQNIDKGLHAIPPSGSPTPFKPAAYFAPGNYSFVKDAMAIWWDPSRTPPGSSTRGCYILPNEGRRHRAGEWPAGDDDVKGDGPCQGDTFT